MTGESTIDYEGLAQEAMRGVVRKVLARTAKSGLIGDHHFYISFETEAPGVTLSKRLREKYPREMTIVLQHRFWDLSVGEDRFEVKLTFDGIPERLVVPFSAVKVFFDPSVRFGLQFEDTDARSEELDAFESLNPPQAGSPRQSTVRKSSRRKPPQSVEKLSEEAPADGAEPAEPTVLPGAARQGSKRSKAVSDDAAPSVSDASEEAEGEQPASAEIVSLDQFRKK